MIPNEGREKVREIDHIAYLLYLIYIYIGRERERKREREGERGIERKKGN